LLGDGLEILDRREPNADWDAKGAALLFLVHAAIKSCQKSNCRKTVGIATTAREVEKWVAVWRLWLGQDADHSVD